MSLKRHLKDYSTVYVVAALSAFTGATVFLASAIKEFTDQLAAYSGILTQDVEHLAPTLQPVIPGADLAGQAQGKAESTVEIEGVTTTACPTQQVNRLNSLDEST